jgi:hypothetical protein
VLNLYEYVSDAAQFLDQLNDLVGAGRVNMAKFHAIVGSCNPRGD